MLKQRTTHAWSQQIRSPLEELTLTRFSLPALFLFASGASSVGKSSLLLRFTDETFLSPDETSGASFFLLFDFYFPFERRETRD